MQSSSTTQDLKLWELVNELCQVIQEYPEQFNPDIHPEYAQRIVQELDHPDNKDILEKRIGNYIITKHRHGWGGNEYRFRRFWLELNDKGHRIISETFIRYGKDQNYITSVGTTIYKHISLPLTGRRLNFAYHASLWSSSTNIK